MYNLSNRERRKDNTGYSIPPQQRDDSSTLGSSSRSSASLSNGSRGTTNLSSPDYEGHTAAQYEDVNAILLNQLTSLQRQVEDLNKARYARLKPTDGTIGRGKNRMRDLKKICMTTNDNINKQAVSAFLREVIWPSNKVLPRNWTKWRDDEDSLCQMISKKIAVPDGVTKKDYWETLLIGFTNDKMCSLRSNFKQDFFEQFQGNLYALFSEQNTCRGLSEVNSRCLALLTF